MAEQFRITVFDSPRGPWRSSTAEAKRDAIALDLASWDSERREWFLAVPVGLERRGRPDPAPTRPRPKPYSPWSADEIEQLTWLVSKGEEPFMIASRIGRSIAACAAKAAKLGLPRDE